MQVAQVSEVKQRVFWVGVGALRRRIWLDCRCAVSGWCQTVAIECESPEGVANSYVISDGPYYVGDRVRSAQFLNLRQLNRSRVLSYQNVHKTLM